MLHRLTLVVVLSAIASGVYAKAPDHPLLSRFPEAKVRKHQQVDYERVALPAGKMKESTNNEFPMLELVGDVTRHFYNVRQVSTLKLYKNYHSALEKLGFKPLYSCELDACGNDRQAEKLGSLVSVENSVYNDYRKPYYLLAQGSGNKGKVTVALFIGGHDGNASVQQVVVEEEALDVEQVSVNPAYLQQQPAPTLAAQASVKPGEDHPLLARYPNAKLRKRQQADYDTIQLPVSAVDTSGNAEQLALVGDLTRQFYVIKNASSLKVYENYKAALAKLKFEPVFSCELAACGENRQAEKLGALVSVEDSVYNYYRKPYYLVAKGTSGQGEVYVALFIGAHEDETAVQQIVLETEALETDLVEVDPDSLKRELDQTGKALIYGIYFDTDKAVVKPESKPALEAIAGLLRNNPELKLYVVGHTDDSGALEHNRQLSANRANAVVASLEKEYKIAPNRLLGQGVGPFAPAASNRSDQGKQSNRRVELVQRLQ